MDMTLKSQEQMIVYSKPAREPIAIIGIGCRFPGAPNPSAFWKLLCEGREAVCDIPTDRSELQDFFDPDPNSPGKMISRRGGFIDDVDRFDWRAFRISPREAKYMDPQHRLLLEVAWEALEDAGLPLKVLAGSNTGVFVGMMWNDYFRLQARDPSHLNGYVATGNAFAFAPSRISYFFDLKGPSLAIDGACAGSLASVHAACQSLWMGESSLALAGGVNLILSPDVNIMLSKAGLLSPDGRCKTLDARADGFVRGEGAGIVVLKPRSQLAPTDRVYAFIRGTAVNHNGRNEWIMAADSAAQEAVIREALRVAGVTPAEIDYVELHGTGLRKGDPIEAKVLGKVIGTHPERKQPCVVGSVKTNIGHLDSAAGIAGIIKVALALNHRMIPPTLHIQNTNPEIPMTSLGLVAQQSLGAWPVKEGPLFGGVTAISMAGGNAHAVLEAPHQNGDDRSWSEDLESGESQLLPLSARTPEALLTRVRSFRDFLVDVESGARFSLRDICYTAGARRSHHEYRLAVIGCSRQELATSLESYLEGRLLPGTFFSRNNRNDEPVHQPDHYEPALREAVSRLLENCDESGAILPLRIEDNDDRPTLLQALGALYVQGHSLDWTALYPCECRCVQLPTYPWHRERLWLEWLNGSPCESALLGTKAHSVTDQSPLACFDKSIAGEGDSAAKQAVDGLSREISNGFLQRLTEAAVNQRRALLMAHVREQVVAVLGLDSLQSMKPQQGLFDAGLNSLGAVELIHRLRDSLRRPLLPTTLVFEHPTVEALADYLASEVLLLEPARKNQAARESEVDGEQEARKLEKLVQLSETEAEALLLEKLGRL